MLDGSVGRFLGGGNNEVADAAALHFGGGTFDDRERIGRDARLDRAVRVGSWGIIGPLFRTISLYGL